MKKTTIFNDEDTIREEDIFDDTEVLPSELIPIANTDLEDRKDER